MVQIFFIYADNCEHCQKALETIESAITKCKNITCDLKKFLYNDKAAIAIAVNKGIDDLPGIVIGDSTFNGNNYTEAAIIKAIKSHERIR
jgi:hypothetical protein